MVTASFGNELRPRGISIMDFWPLKGEDLKSGKGAVDKCDLLKQHFNFGSDGKNSDIISWKNIKIIKLNIYVKKYIWLIKNLWIWYDDAEQLILDFIEYLNRT